MGVPVGVVVGAGVVVVVVGAGVVVFVTAVVVVWTAVVMMQTAELVAATTFKYAPAGHSTHKELPLEFLYVPAGHALQPRTGQTPSSPATVTSFIAIELNSCEMCRYRPVSGVGHVTVCQAPVDEYRPSAHISFSLAIVLSPTEIL